MFDADLEKIIDWFSAHVPETRAATTATISSQIKAMMVMMKAKTCLSRAMVAMEASADVSTMDTAMNDVRDMIDINLSWSVSIGALQSTPVIIY